MKGKNHLTPFNMIYTNSDWGARGNLFLHLEISISLANGGFYDLY